MKQYHAQQIAMSIALGGAFFAMLAFLIILPPTYATGINQSTATATLVGGSGRIVVYGTSHDFQSDEICLLNLPDADDHCFKNSFMGFRWWVQQWHPDGKHVILSGGANIVYPDHYSSLDILTGEFSELVQFRNFLSLTLSPDGKRVAYVVAENQETAIYESDFDGSNKHRITSGLYSDVALSWSPDGYSLAFSAHMGQVEDLFSVNEDGSALTNLTENVLSNTRLFTITRPRWSPDGKQIAFTAFSTGTNYVHLYIMNSDGSNRFDVYPDTQFDVMTFEWAPNSQQFMFGATYGFVYLANRDGSNIHPLPGSDICYQGPNWSPDGTVIICTHLDTNNPTYDLYQINVNTGDLQRLTKNGDFNPYFAYWAPLTLADSEYKATLPSGTPSPASSQTAAAQTATRVQRLVNATQIAGTLFVETQTPPSGQLATLQQMMTQLPATLTAMATTKEP